MGWGKGQEVWRKKVARHNRERSRGVRPGFCPLAYDRRTIIPDQVTHWPYFVGIKMRTDTDPGALQTTYRGEFSPPSPPANFTDRETKAKKSGKTYPKSQGKVGSGRTGI